MTTYTDPNAKLVNDTADAIINILRHMELRTHWEGILDEVKAGMEELEAEKVNEGWNKYDSRHPDGNMGC